MVLRGCACRFGSHGAVLFRTIAGMGAAGPTGRSDAGNHRTRRVAKTLRSSALAAATAAVAVGCASHVVRPAPAPSVDGRCGDEPGICVLGTPAPPDDGGELLGWQCLGLNGGANAACSLPAPAPSLRVGAVDGTTEPGVALPGGASETGGGASGRLSEAGAQEGERRPAPRAQKDRMAIASIARLAAVYWPSVRPLP